MVGVLHNGNRHVERPVTPILRQVRKFVIFVLGMSVVLAGLLMLFLPGPALIVIPAGIAILATEFLWARRLLKGLKNQVAKACDTYQNGTFQNAASNQNGASKNGFHASEPGPEAVSARHRPLPLDD